VNKALEQKLKDTTQQMQGEEWAVFKTVIMKSMWL